MTGRLLAAGRVLAGTRLHAGNAVGSFPKATTAGSGALAIVGGSCSPAGFWRRPSLCSLAGPMGVALSWT